MKDARLRESWLFGGAQDLGDDSERAAGYYDRPWLWDDIRANAANFVLQFHGKRSLRAPCFRPKKRKTMVLSTCDRRR